MPADPRDAVPRAIEFLIQVVIRWSCFGFGGVMGLLSLAAWLRNWSWWVAIPATLLSLSAFAYGSSIRPRGRFHFDRLGPSVIVPLEETPPRDEKT